MNSNKKKYFIDYFIKLKSLILPNDDNINKLILAKKKILQLKKTGGKILIFGNGGSAAIASHFAIDINKNTNFKCMNFSDSSHITCLSNDYGYEEWIKKSLDKFGQKQDIVILISSSGMSKNMINAINKKKRYKSIITFTGFSKSNKLKNLGDINFYVNSSKYNYVENVHQCWLLSLVDCLID
jgi:D-sedoheptulose 7-phosphate isomerase|tara:strand:+ start:11231 stop:11779 length:549 start_codon:yes stop_codon:yes gene_type:complete